MRGTGPPALDRSAVKDVLSGEPDRDRRPSARTPLDTNHHSPERHLIEMRMEGADLDALIVQTRVLPVDELMARRLHKRRLALRAAIVRLELALDPKEPA